MLLPVLEWKQATEEWKSFGEWNFEHLPRPKDVISIPQSDWVDLYEVMYVEHTPVQPGNQFGILRTTVVVAYWKDEPV